MCLYCFDVLLKELKKRRVLTVSPEFLHRPDLECPLFVTWDKRKGNMFPGQYGLRGCIGTLSPKPLSTAIAEYALVAALKDRRFDPINTSEVRDLRVGVSLLVNYEECSHVHDWEVGVHGIIIKFFDSGTEYSATYLPEVAKEQG
mmetsp:Transcript_19427/g.45205  ORF Transcript_19427/g.45205 Transcript_19427/m.45205 type:complete len:145 (+) Transcript_19427:239-673(+)|eukprot:CAMPEP_0116822370 /NCGR_PEP_ID=MMETSP0418-20121206/230_1 /TAXON_ID=1158023 /ORGANISM="Astrosyne radiata, Strain 13vi08-1A" /LENGTH=144 /DNA_ID=CAMNT_0004450475 /DNA_START=206 /DNA_END=640 /DNA_ORIENTATION=+